MFEDLTFLELLAKGGVTVMVLGFLSVLSIAIMLERAWAFRRFSASLRAGAEELGCASGGLSGVESTARALASGCDSPVAVVFLAGYEKRGTTREEVSEAMELAARAEISRLDRFLGILGTIGSTAPFIGLFGTVLGIIRAFSDLAVAAGASPAAVADGIAEALVATAAGLFVAVPAVMAYNYFVRTAGKRALELEVASRGFTGELTRTGTDGLEPQG